MIKGGKLLFPSPPTRRRTLTVLGPDGFAEGKNIYNSRSLTSVSSLVQRLGTPVSKVLLENCNIRLEISKGGVLDPNRDLFDSQLLPRQVEAVPIEQVPRQAQGPGGQAGPNGHGGEGDFLHLEER